MNTYPRDPHGVRRLILVRHCEAVGQDPESPLTDAGLRQAECLRDLLAEQPVDFLVTSEFMRARQSAAPLASMYSLEIHVDARLNERVLTIVPTVDWKEILRRSFSDPDFADCGGETARQVLARAWSLLSEMLRSGYETPVAVSHGNLIALVLHTIDDSFGFEGWEGLSNPDVYLLEEAADGVLGFSRMWS